MAGLGLVVNRLLREKWKTKEATQAVCIHGFVSNSSSTHNCLYFSGGYVVLFSIICCFLLLLFSGGGCCWYCCCLYIIIFFMVLDECTAFVKHVTRDLLLLSESITITFIYILHHISKPNVIHVRYVKRIKQCTLIVSLLLLLKNI